MTIFGFARVLLSNQGWVRSLWFLHTIVAIAWWASNIHPQVTQFLSFQQKNLAKRVREEGLLKQLQKLLSVLRIRHHLWTACGLSMAQKELPNLSLSLDPCWNESFLLWLKKSKKKHYTHKEGSKEGSLYSYVFHTWDLTSSHFFSFL